ncbi:Vegetative incompatibility protein HET-E-1 [Cercospora beticola]|uniref:Vegetative incompatibility protein HET-E-1 n=1 Tax=Cercospora beticola TaxID=122368 RepID=A0A2G5HXT9_CERBT|nr:Vegetative incompatibility protein HET-E-1 [Cercospora beticola]PIA97052.1 Vegetative incompatibility protein HET-E-1 [Cercospora beticola]WPA98831.1 hypothetical protein RHO25_003444 [Cercospora beticola]CAK1360113.1 unnamed protein product [Cercospora beticola]
MSTLEFGIGPASDREPRREREQRDHADTRKQFPQPESRPSRSLRLEPETLQCYSFDGQPGACSADPDLEERTLCPTSTYHEHDSRAGAADARNGHSPQPSLFAKTPVKRCYHADEGYRKAAELIALYKPNDRPFTELVLVHNAVKPRERTRSLSHEGLVSQAEDVERLFHGYDAPQDTLLELSVERTVGSCQWVLDQANMKCFLNDTASQPQLLWCFAGPGSGKSFTVTYIIESLLENSKSCAYYYFRSNHQEKNNLSHFLASIAWQLSRFIPEYQAELASLARESFEVSKAGYKLLWKKLFMSSLLRCNIMEPFYVVVDGLDEFRQTEELLQRLLVELANANIPVRLLMISRRTLEIETSIERLKAYMDVLSLSLENNTEDIEMYVRDQLEFMPGDSGFKERIVNEVLEKADGTFLWAHLVVQELVECRTDFEAEEVLQRVPEGLAPLYERMDEHLAETFRYRPETRELGRIIIIWASCARRPLHLDELRTALDDNYPEITDIGRTIRECCGDFVNIDKNGCVTMAHASVREVLMSNSALNFHVDVHKSHHTLFTRCIRRLTPGRKDDSARGNRALAFDAYAASSWPFHLKLSLGFDDYSSLDSVMALLRSRAALDWIKLLAEAGQLRAIIQASKALEEFLVALNEASPEVDSSWLIRHDQNFLLQWTQDLVHVVGTFGSQIIRSPMSVYNLMPAFCPKESILYQQFGTACQNSLPVEQPRLKIRGDLNPLWDDCFANFAVASDSTPTSILSLGHYFAILTKGDGTVHIYNANTCELTQRLSHGDRVLTFSADSSSSRIATYGLRKTTIWNIESGELICSMENPKYARALTICFQQSKQLGETLLTFSDDRVLRICSLSAMRFQWRCFGGSLDSDSTQPYQVNAPHNAQFSPDGLYIAISYRGANPAVWFLGGIEPCFVAYLDRHGSSSPRTAISRHQHTRASHAGAFAWNPLTGHLLGTYFDGGVFRWHPQHRDLDVHKFRGNAIKCSADGRIFVTGGKNGTIRIWNFEHFIPIAQIQYPSLIRDLDINEARVYDLREQFCNIWEPSGLLRALEEGDETASDNYFGCEKDDQSVVAESRREQEEFESITALLTFRGESLYAFGDEGGKITIANFDGKVVAEVPGGFMSIEHLSWCKRACLLASVDLGHDITIRKIDNLHDGLYQTKNIETVRTFSESEEVLQILLDTDGDTLLVVTPSATKLHLVFEDLAPIIVPAARPSKWIIHPRDKSLALGFSADHVTVMSLESPLESTCLPYKAFRADGDQFSIAQLFSADRPSQAYPFSPSDINHTVHKVYISPDNTLAIIDIYNAMIHSNRRTACLLLEMKHFEIEALPQSIPVRLVPSRLIEVLYMPLGFVDAELINSSPRRDSFTEQLIYSTFIFVDRDFWVCSVNLTFAETQGPDAVIRKHFFLPRDWQNAELLEMASITPAGDVLFPRHGKVAVVSNGLFEEFTV